MANLWSISTLHLLHMEKVGELVINIKTKKKTLQTYLYLPTYLTLDSLVPNNGLKTMVFEWSDFRYLNGSIIQMPVI